MKFLKTLAIFFFDILDHLHQKKILNFFQDKKIKINSLIDIGAHKGKYTDLFLSDIDLSNLFPPKFCKKICEANLLYKRPLACLFNSKLQNSLLEVLKPPANVLTLMPLDK